MTNYIQVLPNAASLIESLRNIGYTFESALSDIIDNSISADSHNINLFQQFIDGDPIIQVIDDGFGMNETELIHAMRLGSKNPTEMRHKNDLGRFGLGLKSASFSQCKLLTVISKSNRQIHAYQWDLDFIKQTNKFEIKKLSKSEITKIPNIRLLDKTKTGTIVQWEKFDRLAASSDNLDDEISILMNKAIDHLSLVFHRFIVEDKLNISVNNTPIEPKEPFLLSNPKTQELKSKTISIDGVPIKLYTYVLPHYSNLSSADKRKAGKVNEQFKSQGFYLYRNKRLIVWGDYLGIARKSELGKNTRIQVDIPNTLDYLWEIDVKKSRATVPPKIKKNLLSAVEAGNHASRKVNTYRGKKELQDDSPIWSFYLEREDNFHLELNPENQLYQNFTQSLNDEQKALFQMFSKSISESIPFQTIYSQISEGNKNDSYDDDILISDIKNLIDKVKNNSQLDINVLLKSLLKSEPYSSSKIVNTFIKNQLGDLNE